ncbi:taste receptor type 1 member 3 [Myripristis murdjan]|uniref:Taste receptor type 1 member 3 n=1 Tax=Myripristis murdjan TaxID=586833 RepID=A0A667WGU0_9TELE|nr:taste receptor type 1 member 3 [Myripristis murdjan]
MAVTFKLLALCCLVGLSCSSPEWFENISTNLFNLPGDIMLGGLFPINLLTSNLSLRVEPGEISCKSLNEYGLGLALTMKYTVDEINANQTLLPGIKLGYEIFDTCLQSAIIVTPTFFFLTEKSTSKLDVKCNYTNYETRIAAVIGPYSSEMVSIIGKLLGFFLMPQISYGATSDKFSDKLLYPSFLRTAPSDKWQAEAMVRLLREFNWNWVAVVGSEDEYGQEGQREFSKIAAKMSICVAYEGLIPIYRNATPAVKAILDNINATKVGVVVIFSLAEPAVAFFKEVIRRNITGVWIASTAWAIHNHLISLPDIHTVGTIIGFTDNYQKLDLFTSYTQVLFTRLSEERTKPNPGTTDPDSPCPQCWNLSPDNISLVTQPVVQNNAYSVYAAIYSVAQALHNMLGCNSTTCVWTPDSKIYPWQLLQVLKNVSLDINGIHLAFDSNGNPNIGYNIVEWVWENSNTHFIQVGTFNKKLSINKNLFKWHTPNSELPLSTCSAACVAGQVRRVKGFHSCCFDCIDCKAGTFQANKDDFECTQCPDRQWSLIRSTNCTDPTFDFLFWSNPESLVMMLAGGVLLVCQISVGVVFMKHRGTPLISTSGGALSGVALLGLMGSCLSLLLFLGQPTDLKCKLQLPLISISQTVCMSIIMAVALQIFLVTEFPAKAVSHLDTIKGRGRWLLVLACCCVQAGICGWAVQTEPSLSEYLATLNINFVRRFLSCPMKSFVGIVLMQGFNGALALTSFMCTFMSVKPVRQYNLARDITFSSLIYSVIWVIFIPIYTGLDDKPKCITHLSFSLASNMGLVAAYYFPKCHLLLKKPELNTPDHFRTFLEGVPPTPEEAPQPDPQPQPGQ